MSFQTDRFESLTVGLGTSLVNIHSNPMHTSGINPRPGWCTQANFCATCLAGAVFEIERYPRCVRSPGRFVADQEICRRNLTIALAPVHTKASCAGAWSVTM